MNLYKVVLSPNNAIHKRILLGTYASDSGNDAIKIALWDAQRNGETLPKGNLIATSMGADRRVSKMRPATKKELVHRNPKRPPKKWFQDCTSAVERSGARVSPAKICGAEWYKKMSKAAKHRAMRMEKNPKHPTSTYRNWWNTRLTEGRRQALLERVQMVDGPIELANKEYLNLPFAQWLWSNRDKLKIKVKKNHIMGNIASAIGAHMVLKKNPQKPVRWFLGLTKDFRKWDVFGTNLDPRTHKLYEDYVWFYGPFDSKQEALLFKKTENLQR